MTTQRMLLLELLRRGEHLDADELYRRAKERYHRISISTVYRSLRLFSRLNLVEEHRFHGLCSCYEALAGATHHHLLCLGCGKIIDIEYSLSKIAKRNIKNMKGVHITGVKVLFLGYCSKCLLKNGKELALIPGAIYR